MIKKNLMTVLLIAATALIVINFNSCSKDDDEDEDGFMTDSRDGKKYEIVQIGNQWWMGENLNYDAGSGSCVYDSIASNAEIYGRLYDRETAGAVCPDGWHLPSDAEWEELIDYLGGAYIAGGKMKEAGTTHWTSPNTGATNESGFTALPGGGRSTLHGGFYGLGSNAVFCSSTDVSSRDLSWATHYVTYTSNNEAMVYSVRCVRDN